MTSDIINNKRKRREYITVLLRRTGMPGAVMLRINVREYDNRVLRNVNSSKRSTRSIPHITKCWARVAIRAHSSLTIYYIVLGVHHDHSVIAVIGSRWSPSDLSDQYQNYRVVRGPSLHGQSCHVILAGCITSAITL